MPILEIPQKRISPINISYPTNSTDSIVYILGTFANQSYLIKLPQNVTIASKFGSYSLSFKQEEDTVFVKRSYKLASGIYQLSDYQLFYAFIQKIRKIDNKSQIILYQP